MKLTTHLLALATLSGSLVSSAFAAPETYTIDKSHSSVGFSIRHFVAKVPGKFNDFAGSIVFDRDNPEKSSVEATIKVASVDTENQRRDDHLRNPDFFDVAKYPDMKFKSTAWKKTGNDTFDVTGDLTLKDVTKPVTLKVTLLGIAPGMRGQLSGWEATTTINKADFNVKDPAALDVTLGDDVTITINIEAAQTRT